MGVYDLSEKLELEQREGLWAGNLDGFYYSVVDTKIGLKVTTINLVFEQSIDNTMRLQIQKATRVIVLSKSVMKKNDAISLVINYQVKQNIEAYIERTVDIIQRAIEIFKSLNLTQYQECFLCGKETDEIVSLQTFQEFVVPMHNDCLVQYDEFLIEQKKAEDKKVKLLPISIFYSIIGAIIGLIPSIITIVALQMIFAWLFALIPLAAFYGYKFGGAPHRKYTTIIISVVSFLVVIVSQITFWHIDAVSKGYNDIFHSLRMEENMQIFSSNLLKSLLFTGLGILISWQIITKKK